MLLFCRDSISVSLSRYQSLSDTRSGMKLSRRYCDDTFFRRGSPVARQP